MADERAADERAAPQPAPARHAEIAGSQGVQVGDGNIQINLPPGGGQPAGRVVAGEIPQEPVAFRPRAGLLACLRSGPGIAVVTAVTGMRGVGKTQLAAAVARECADAGWRLVAWVNAQDAASVLAGLAVVAARLGIAPRAGAQDAALAVRNWLEADGRSCLLVFDNAPDLDVVRRFLPAAGGARVVVTTTGALPGISGTLVRVGVFSEADGLAFLAGRTGLADEAGARAVAEELGWLPLGLAQAGAVIAAQRLSYRVYLDRLRQVPVAEYLAAGPGDPYSHGVAQAVLLSLEAAAGGNDPAAGACRAVLDLVAVLSPAGVSRSLLYAAAASGALPGCDGTRGEWLVDEAAGRLAGRSLLSFSGDGDSLGDGGSLSAHRLVTRVARERAAREGSLAPLGMRACGLLRAVVDELGEPWQHRAGARDVIGQVTALHQHLLPCLDDSPDLATELLSLRGWAVSWLNQLGDAAGLAVELARAVLADRERLLGQDHPETLTSRHSLAYAYQAAGRLGESIGLYEAGLADWERVLGQDHPNTLTSRNNLATIYQAAGRLDDAIELYEATLADRERVLGQAHPDTLGSRNNLAHAYREAGRLGEAIPLFEATLADRERVLGHDQPDTLMSRNNLAAAYKAAGRSSGKWKFARGKRDRAG